MKECFMIEVWITVMIGRQVISRVSLLDALEDRPTPGYFGNHAGLRYSNLLGKTAVTLDSPE